MKKWRKELHKGTHGERLMKYGLIIAAVGVIALIAVPLIKVLGTVAIIIGVAILLWGLVTKGKEKK